MGAGVVSHSSQSDSRDYLGVDFRLFREAETSSQPLPCKCPSFRFKSSSQFLRRSRTGRLGSCKGSDPLQIWLCFIGHPAIMPRRGFTPQRPAEAGSATSSTGKRVRAKHACRECNARRVKCNVTQCHPCSNCESTGTQCEVLPSRRGR